MKKGLFECAGIYAKQNSCGLKTMRFRLVFAADRKKACAYNCGYSFGDNIFPFDDKACKTDCKRE